MGPHQMQPRHELKAPGGMGGFLNQRGVTIAHTPWFSTPACPAPGALPPERRRWRPLLGDQQAAGKMLQQRFGG